MTFTGSIADRLAIRELLDTYADAVFRRDAEAWGACWADDAVWTLAGPGLHSRATLVAAWKTAMAPFRLAIFQVAPGAIAIDGDTAQVRSYTNEQLLAVEGATRRIAGRYDDELVRTAEGWRFAARRYALLHEDHAGAA